MTTIFVIVDDWYRKQVKNTTVLKPGAKARMSDSEIITLALVMDYVPFPGETQFLGFIRGNYREWFPNLLDQSQFNRRLRKLDGMLENLRRSWVEQLVGETEKYFLLDTKPLPVLGLKRDKRYSDFAGSAAPGRCAAREMSYFGYKLVMLSTWNGIPIAYDLVPANTDERVAAEGVLEMVQHSDIYADKGFISAHWQAAMAHHTGNRIWTLTRDNQHFQHSYTLKRFISRVRQRVEGVFHEIQNTGRNPERLLNKTIDGFCVHIAAFHCISHSTSIASSPFWH
ncbi:IS982 family transposase [Tolypothrix sp. NIES-4075]|uniref:IS982 family transposase n=1 Tax=Tolypothrix sp. NIES-4075 TaxID=2005459 RepID=UPI001F2A93F0|nr:IS982 family transposase [Tolypothrix sp. NIES-4075]